jgi:hypothetical protein
MPMDKPDFIALAPAKLMARYRQQLAKVIARHPMRPGRLYSITLPLPKLDLHLFTGTEAHWFYWGLPEQGCERVGIGKGCHSFFMARRDSASCLDIFNSLGRPGTGTTQSGLQ